MVGRLYARPRLEIGKPSTAKKWGFAFPDTQREAYAFGADFDEVLSALDNVLGIERHLPNVYGEVVDLSNWKVALLYRLKGYEHIILDVDRIIIKTHLLVELWRLSELLPGSMVAKFFTGEETGYAIYQDGKLEKCFVPGPLRIRGYEDITGDALWPQWRRLMVASEAGQIGRGREEDIPTFCNYYHAIDKTEGIDRFVMKEEITAETPYPRGRIMDRLGIHILELVQDQDSESSNDYLIDCAEIGEEPFDRIDCLWFSEYAYTESSS